MLLGIKRMVASGNLLRSSTSKNNLCASPLNKSRLDGSALLPPLPNRLLDLGRDVLDNIASFCHPLDLARLSLCSKDMLREVEESARCLSVRLRRNSNGNLPSTNWSRRSWRYEYLRLLELTLVDNEPLRLVLANIYFKDNNNGPKDRLNLYGMNIGDEGAAHLALALRVSQDHRVDSINLCRNNISDAGARMLIDAVGRRQEMESLSLSQNRIGVKGARYIADLICRSVGLKNLSLSDNPLTDEGARVIGCALQNGSSLATLSMRSVHLSVNVRDDLRGQWAGSHKSAIWGLYL